MNPLIIIPVRGGSKGIPRKNLRLVAGLSLTTRAIRTARRACALLGGGRVVVDTDDEAIAAEARQWGAETPYMRPAVLASDAASSLEVLRNALEQLSVSADDPRPIVLVQATSPLLPPGHVVDVVRAFAESAGAPVVSITEARSHPAWTYSRGSDGILVPWFRESSATRRQDLSTAWTPSGAVYVASSRHLLEGRGFLEAGVTRGVPLSPALAIDVDEEADLVAADAVASHTPSPIRIADRAIGPGAPCFIIAEAGVNHDGDVSEAHHLVDAAADIGADAVKFQTWQTALLVRPGAPQAAYQREHDPAADQFEMLKRLELPYAAHAELKAHAQERGIQFLSTPDEIESARFLVSLGVAALKVGSAELDNLPYLALLAGLGLPLLISTGMGTLDEVAAALDCVAANGGPPVALFHTVSAYPAPVDALNVRAIATLSRAFSVPVGLSDHYPGPEAVLAAVGVGLPLWEKHLTRSRSRHGPDHQASLEPDEFGRQIAQVRLAERALGDGRKVPQDPELATRSVVRKRLCARQDRAAGERLTAEDVVALRANRGLPVNRLEAVLGQVLRIAIRAGDPITEEHFGG